MRNFKLFLLRIFASERTSRSQTALFGGDQRRGAVSLLALGLADHAANRFTAFAAIDRGVVMGVDLRGRARAGLDGGGHFRRIEAPAHTDDHENHLQRLRLIVNRVATDVPGGGVSQGQARL
jgi:hypothetical protein